jgi:hypothetical protein
MSRNIDLTKPLSDEDRDYLLARARHREIALADANAAGTTPEPSLPDDSLTGSTPRSPDAQPASVGAQNAASGGTADNPLASPATDHTADGSDEPQDNYDDTEAWSYEDIKSEVSDRESDDSPALNSSRADLIAWLRKDDQDSDQS